jgi:hypothetical protein
MGWKLDRGLQTRRTVMTDNRQLVDDLHADLIRMEDR